MDGGAGIDTLDYRTSTAAVNANLATGSGLGGDADGDVFSNFERILGSSDNDTLTGDAERNVLFGRGGADVLDGGEGRDRLGGGSGNDTMSGGLGRDTFFFGAGNDKLDGGADWDVALFSGDQVEFYVANSNRNSWTVTQISTGDTDILTNIEALQFSDGSLFNF